MTPQSHTILVVDDTPANIDVVKEILRRDYHLQAAVNGSIALDLISKKRPDLILLDVMMPDMDGYEVCRRLKSHSRTRNIPVIFLTAMNQVEDEAKGFRIGAADYIMKPVNPAILTERVATHIALSKQRSELADALKQVSQSIQYASRIQRSILSDTKILKPTLKDFFVLWKPRDVVGGDIYWCHKWGDGLLVVLADCTGHGVPGAFITLLAAGALDHARAAVAQGDLQQLVSEFHQTLQETLGQHRTDGESDDGLELGACYINRKMERITYVGAKFDLFVVDDGNVNVVRGTKKGLAYRGIPKNQSYDIHEIELIPDRCFYMTSDGFIDQVGGERKRSFGKKRFQKLLLDTQELSMSEQKEKIYQALVDYQGDQVRRDDISAIGFQVQED